MDEPAEQPTTKTFIGGRHGSPTVTIALPFSSVKQVDTEVRDAVADLATLVARLADPETDDEGRAAVRTAAEELADRLRQDR